MEQNEDGSHTRRGEGTERRAEEAERGETDFVTGSLMQMHLQLICIRATFSLKGAFVLLRPRLGRD